MFIRPWISRTSRDCVHAGTLHPNFREAYLEPAARWRRMMTSFRAWLKRLSVPGALFWNPGANPLKELVEHFRGHSHEVDEFSLILSSKLDHHVIMDAILPTSLDPGFDPARPVALSSPSSSGLYIGILLAFTHAVDVVESHLTCIDDLEYGFSVRRLYQSHNMQGKTCSAISVWMQSYCSTARIWARSCESMSYATCEQQRCRSACASAQSDQHLCCSLLR